MIINNIMRNLNFKVSKDIATLLANIAHEHILYNYDYEKALNVSAPTSASTSTMLF